MTVITLCEMKDSLSWNIVTAHGNNLWRPITQSQVLLWISFSRTVKIHQDLLFMEIPLKCISKLKVQGKQIKAPKQSFKEYGLLWLHSDESPHISKAGRGLPLVV